MKKLIVVTLFLVLVSSIVLAKDNKGIGNKSIENIVCCKTFGYGTGMIVTNVKYGWKQQSECRLPENFVGGGMEIVEDKYCIGEKEVGIKLEVKGLNNAIVKVKNNETRQHLEEVLNKILEQRREVLSKLEALEIRENADGAVEAEGKKEMKFLGFLNVKRKVKYIIDENGEIIRQPRGFDFLFQES